MLNTNESEGVVFPVWVDGTLASSVPADDRGLAYGDGLFETIRISRGQPVFLELHLERLERSLGRLGFLQTDFRKQIFSYLASFQVPDQAILKLVVTRGSGGRGYSAAGCDQPRVISSLHRLPDRQSWYEGIALYGCNTRLGLNPLLAGMKHLNRLEQVMGRSEWDSSEYQEGLMLDLNERPVEGTMSNLFLVYDGQLYTPQLDFCGVAGVAREVILAEANARGMSCKVADLTLAEVEQADEVFMCNSVFGIWPVIRYQQQRWPVGAVTRSYQVLFDRFFA